MRISDWSSNVCSSDLRRRRAENFLTEISDLQEKDLVVHVDHGVGRYEGLETLDATGAPHDFLKVIYQGGDKLYVPVENIEVLSRFGSEREGVELDRLRSEEHTSEHQSLIRHSYSIFCL